MGQTSDGECQNQEKVSYEYKRTAKKGRVAPGVYMYAKCPDCGNMVSLWWGGSCGCGGVVIDVKFGEGCICSGTAKTMDLYKAICEEAIDRSRVLIEETIHMNRKNLSETSADKKKVNTTKVKPKQKSVQSSIWK